MQVHHKNTVPSRNENIVINLSMSIFTSIVLFILIVTV
jgi:hypothetical protein